MAIRVREINGKSYMYFIHYPDGKKVDVYCGAESKPESKKKALRMEIEETRKQIDELSVKLTDLTGQLRAVNKDAKARTPPPERQAGR